jgi:hypothetical protein
VRIGETEQTMKDLKKAIYGSIASVIITAVVAWISWSNMQVQRDLQAQVAEVVKHQAAEKK